MWEKQTITGELLLSIYGIIAVILIVLILTSQLGITMKNLSNFITRLVVRIMQKVYFAITFLWDLTDNVTCLDEWRITMNFSRLWLDMSSEAKRCEELVVIALVDKKYNDVYYWNAQKNALRMSQKVMKKTTLEYNKALRNMKLQRDSVSKTYVDLFQEEGAATISNEFFRGQMSMANKFLNLIGENERGMYGKEEEIKKKNA